MSDSTSTEVLVIGAGASGALAAAQLAAAGLEVTALEAGPRWEPRDFMLDDVAGLARNVYGAPKVNHEIPTVREPGEDAARAAVNPALMLNGVGGSKLHSTSSSWRLLPWNFESRTRTVERYGAGAIPAGSTVADWPLAYEDLAPYYDRVEELYGISGKAGNIEGEIDPGGNVFEGPRSGEFPLPPLREAGYTRMISEAARGLGWKPFPGPASIRSEAYDGLPGCSYCGICTWNGCWVNAKGLAYLSGVPEALATGNLKILTGSRVTEILTDAEGRARGVEHLYRGRKEEIEAKFVILATFAYENTRLLLSSASTAHPDGLGNRHRQVGKHFMTHSFAMQYGLFADRRLNAFGGSGAQATAIDDFNADNFDHSDLGFIGGSVILAPQEARLLMFAHATPPEVPRWGAGWKDWMAKHTNSTAWMYVQPDQLPYEDVYLDLDPGVTDQIGMPVVRCTFEFKENERRQLDFLFERCEELYEAAGAARSWHTEVAPVPVSTHAYGGTRMGEDPESSVVDGFGIAHEVPNLAILGASTFPTAGGLNPTETVEALAWRTTDHVRDNWDRLTA